MMDEVDGWSVQIWEGSDQTKEWEQWMRLASYNQVIALISSIN
jgi:hypothetical protein